MTDHYADVLDAPVHDETTEADHDQQAADWAGEDER